MAQEGSTGYWRVGSLLSKYALKLAPQLLSASGAIVANRPGYFVITKAGVAAMTLAAPPAANKLGNGMVIIITSRTANAHTVTATGLLNTGSAFVNVATFNANAGATLGLISDNALWNVLFANGVSFS